MYERMLNKQSVPTYAELTAYCGDGADSFALLNAWLTEACGTAQEIVFPYGKQYGWGVSHKIKKNFICNVFAENGAFTVMTRLTDAQINAVYDKLGEYAKNIIDNKYPCSDGGWIHFRVLNKEHLQDAQTFLAAKCARRLPANPV